MHDLSEFSKQLKSALKSGSSAPLVLAAEVAALADDWSSHVQQLDEQCSCTQWLKSVCGSGRGLGWWLKRDNAVHVLGESCRRTTHHEVAVWAIGVVESERMAEAARVLADERRKNHNIPITPAQARVALRAAGLVARVRHRRCVKCVRLEEWIKSHGWPMPPEYVE